MNSNSFGGSRGSVGNSAHVQASVVGVGGGHPSNVYDCSHLALKDDHERRPLWIIWLQGNDQRTDDNRIILEAFSPEYKNATDFLIAIAEPVSRPSHIHEYKLTKYSLYAAASVGLTDTDIEKVLDRFCKNRQIPQEVLEFIKLHCSSYGKAKIVLKSNSYFIEANDRPTMERLLSFPAVAQGVKNAQIEAE